MDISRALSFSLFPTRCLNFFRCVFISLLLLLLLHLAHVKYVYDLWNFTLIFVLWYVFLRILIQKKIIKTLGCIWCKFRLKFCTCGCNDDACVILEVFSLICNDFLLIKFYFYYCNCYKERNKYLFFDFWILFISCYFKICKNKKLWAQNCNNCIHLEFVYIALIGTSSINQIYDIFIYKVCLKHRSCNLYEIISTGELFAFSKVLQRFSFVVNYIPNKPEPFFGNTGFWSNLVLQNKTGEFTHNWNLASHRNGRLPHFQKCFWFKNSSFIFDVTVWRASVAKMTARPAA